MNVLVRYIKRPSDMPGKQRQEHCYCEFRREDDGVICDGVACTDNGVIGETATETYLVIMTMYWGGALAVSADEYVISFRYSEAELVDWRRILGVVERNLQRILGIEGKDPQVRFVRQTDHHVTQ